MKQILIFAIFLLQISFVSFSQNIEMHYNNGKINSGDTIKLYGDSTSGLDINIDIKNLSATDSIKVKVKKQYINSNDSCFTDGFCWIQCYDKNTMVSLVFVNIKPGGETTAFQSVYSSQCCGTTIIKYTFFDISNLKDSAYFYARYRISCAGINEKHIASSSFAIFPNPAVNNFTVKYNLSNNETGYIKIYNQSGNIVFSKKLTANDNELNINVADWNAGLYFCNIFTSNNVIETKKLIIIK